MTESMKEVIARLKANQNSQNSQQLRKIAEMPVAPKEIPAPAPIGDEEELDEDELGEEMPVEAGKPPVMPQKQGTEASRGQVVSDAEKVQQELIFLQDNGIFRQQLLHQLQEINKALVVMAGVLVDLSGNGQK